MDLVTFIFRNNYAWVHGSPTSQLKKELARAREHLRVRFGRNPAATRRSVRHAAMIIGVSREFTAYSPCETMRVFFSFAFLLAFVSFFPFDQVQPTLPGPIPPVRLDESPLQRFQSANSFDQIQRWIEQGGPAQLESIDDICNVHNFPALKQLALRTLGRLRAWGLAKKFHRILKNFDRN